MIQIILDTREHDLIEQLTGLAGIEDVEVKPLDVGDIEFRISGEESAALVIERKTADDFGASLRDGRYREQRARLLALKGTGKTRIGYVIEVEQGVKSWCRGAFTERDLMRNIGRLQFRYGIPVFVTYEGVRGTIKWIKHWKEQLEDDGEVFSSESAMDAAANYTNAIAIKKKSNQSIERVDLAILTAIPGIGAKVAQAVLDNVANIHTLVSKTKEEIAAIPCGDRRKVGAAAAEKIWSALNHE
jgi:ERCC4-type nuclease